MRDSLSILVVDDMKFSCEFIRRALIQEGFNDIKVVNNAHDALFQLEEKAVDVVLADWLMPEMDGLELTQQIRQLDEERHHYTGIVLLTAKDDMASVRDAFEGGVDDYITKPPNRIELAARIYAAGRVATMQNDLLDTTQTMRKMFELKCQIDQVTGLGRSEDTQQRLDVLLQQTQSRGGATCCAILKINEFDQLKNKHGLAVQEQLLASTANRISRFVRPMDLVGHLDQDEFLIAMYFSNEDDARCRNFKRILHDLNHRSIKTAHGFLNIKCAMAMSNVHKGNMAADVEAFVADIRHKLQLSAETGFKEVVT